LEDNIKREVKSGFQKYLINQKRRFFITLKKLLPDFSFFHKSRKYLPSQAIESNIIKNGSFMPNNQKILTEVQEYVSNLLVSEIPEYLYYHNLTHTSYVVEYTQIIGKALGLSEDDLHTLELAAWWHDVGYLKVSVGHEELSQELAEIFFKEKKLTLKKIKKILGCIEATKMPQTPQNALEEIICDADLAHLAAKDFWDRCSFLRKEWETMRGSKMTQMEWLLINKNFMGKHHYFTEYGKEVLNIQKKKNARKIDRLIKKEEKRLEEAE
jgi:predicted metal-dependent HD superfamily phosphohydrolase